MTKYKFTRFTFACSAGNNNHIWTSNSMSDMYCPFCRHFGGYIIRQEYVEKDSVTGDEKVLKDVK